MQPMKSFFFTYGTDKGYPFCGGWTQVNAPSREAACAAFKAIHPCRTGNLLNCASVYDEATFKATDMYAMCNLGARCHEVITLMVYPGEEHWNDKEGN